MNTNDTTGNKGNPTVIRESESQALGESTDVLTTGADTQERATTRPETTAISLADVIGRDDDGKKIVPDTAMAVVHELTDNVLEVTRNGHTFTVEIGLTDIAEVTLVDGKRPEHIPDWLAAVVRERYGAREVTL